MPRCRLALGDLVFMVREDQVLPAAVDIKRFAEDRHAHRRALDMPARPALAPGGIPARLARLFRLPEREIERIALRLVGIDARAVLQIVNILSGELAIARKTADGEVHISIRRGISVALCNQRLHQRDDFANVLRRARVHRRALNAEGVRVVVILLDKPLAELLDRCPLLVRAADHLVVNIRKILYKAHVITAIFQIAAQRIEYDKRARVANMKIVVNRRTAGIHGYLSGYERYELFLFARHRIIDLHGVSSIFVHYITNYSSRRGLSRRQPLCMDPVFARGRRLPLR
ncbi:hypothetical protein SDC9_124052 [bioreactor metagenome]|uniref:Uncharacterized protein n=1 Tax=bioreactor metagenome TaxID=1076179 RepID=A0A645CJF5_9ZZZZ